MTMQRQKKILPPNKQTKNMRHFTSRILREKTIINRSTAQKLWYSGYFIILDENVKLRGNACHFYFTILWRTQLYTNTVQIHLNGSGRFTADMFRMVLGGVTFLFFSLFFVFFLALHLGWAELGVQSPLPHGGSKLGPVLQLVFYAGKHSKPAQASKNLIDSFCIW